MKKMMVLIIFLCLASSAYSQSAIWTENGSITLPNDKTVPNSTYTISGLVNLFWVERQHFATNSSDITGLEGRYIPLQGVKIYLFNIQGQQIGSDITGDGGTIAGKTKNRGTFSITVPSRGPYYLECIYDHFIGTEQGNLTDFAYPAIIFLGSGREGGRNDVNDSITVSLLTHNSLSRANIEESAQILMLERVGKAILPNDLSLQKSYVNRIWGQ